ncbi:hypothetical protein Goe26_00970 [Bacillus phage vB_BsuM-Goe26]|nr:hypothetical protein Goe26_00970 [Bacillus phage vB_BsuM-Goe26]
MGFFDRISGAYQSMRGLVTSPLTKSFAEEIQESNLLTQVDLNPEQRLGPSHEALAKSIAAQKTKAQLEDPFGITEAMGYKDKPFSLSYDILRRMANKDAVIASIITTRVNQVSTFTTPARFSRSGMGYEIRLRDPNEEVTEKDLETITAIEKFLENTGFDNDNERDDFDTFVRKITRDRLTFDQVAIETVPDRKGRPAEFYAVDAATIRVASEKIREDNSLNIKDKDKIRYVQVLNGEIQAYFTSSELGFAVSNPRTDIGVAPYGFSELEMLIHQVTAHLWAEEYNSRFFSQGGTTKGIINLKNDGNEPIDAGMLESFKRQWKSQVSGMTGAWKTPVLSVSGLEYIDVSQSNREMEFEKWMNYLINIACAVYQIDPSEINFPNRGGAGNTGGGGLGNGGIKDRLSHSKDKGLRPLLRFIEMVINKFIISKFDERYVFTFVGIDAKSDSELIELQKSQVETFKTLNEIRKENGQEPLPHGDVVLNSNYINYLQSLNTSTTEDEDQQQEVPNEEQLNEDDEDKEKKPKKDDEDKKEDKDKDKDKDSKKQKKDDKVDPEEVSDDKNKDTSSKDVSKSETKFLRIELE